MLSLMGKIGDRVLDAFVYCVAGLIKLWCRVFGHRVLPLKLTMQERFPINVVIAHCHRCEHQVNAGGTIKILPPGPIASVDLMVAHARDRASRSERR